MYNRTLFAQLKRRTHMDVDHIRGDLNIEPLKIGYFDVATVPSIDLVKGYFGEFTDIEQTNDLQSVSYARKYDQQGGDTTTRSDRLDTLLTKLNQETMKPKLAYQPEPILNFDH